MMTIGMAIRFHRYVQCSVVSRLALSMLKVGMINAKKRHCQCKKIGIDKVVLGCSFVLGVNQVSSSPQAQDRARRPTIMLTHIDAKY